MTTNDEFFKKTQENLRRIKAENNKKTMKIYKIDGKAEELPSTQPSKPQQPQQENNVVSLDAFRKNKEPKTVKKEEPLEERQKRIAESIKRINDLMEQLQNNNRTSND